jgi:hypothetical protein
MAVGHSTPRHPARIAAALQPAGACGQLRVVSGLEKLFQMARLKEKMGRWRGRATRSAIFSIKRSQLE